MSLPLQGAARAQAVAAVNGAKLALEQSGGKAGDYKIKYESLDDSTAQQGGWEPGVTSANALKAAGDDSTIGYIGEFNSGATAVSLPILNEAGIAQVSPGNTAVGITSNDLGAEPGEPDKYYPSGVRTYARVAAEGHLPGRARSSPSPKEEGCARSAFVLNDKEVYGAGLAKNVELPGAEAGARDQGQRGRSTRTPPTTALVASNIKATGAECFDLQRASRPTTPSRSLKDVAAALRPELSTARTALPRSASSPTRTAASPPTSQQVKCHVAGPVPGSVPAGGPGVLQASSPRSTARSTLTLRDYGYEAMKLALDAIERSGDGPRRPSLGPST